MKKILIILLLSAIQIPAISQEKGSYLTASGSLGLQGFKYIPKGINTDGYNNLELGWNGGIGYSYFFTKYFGVSLGVEMSYFQSSGGYDIGFRKDEFYNIGNQIDNDFYINNPNMPFQLRARLANWKEEQAGYTFNIPLLLVFQYKFGLQKRHGLYYGIGAKVQIPFISTKYQVIDSKYQNQGMLNISGYYPDWHLEIGSSGDPQVPQHGYGTIHNPKEALGWKGNTKVKTSYSATVEIGYLYGISPKVDLTLGGYIDYGINNIKDSESNIPLMQANNPYHSENYYGEQYIGKGIKYNGLMNSDRTDHINLLGYGAKIGLRIKLGNKKNDMFYAIKQPCQIKSDTIYINSKNTIFILDTIHLIDLIIQHSCSEATNSQSREEYLTLNGNVIDDKTKNIIPNAKILLIDDNTKEILASTLDSNYNASFEVERGHKYTIIANAKMYQDGEIEFQIDQNDSTKVFNRTIELSKFSKGQTFTLENIYYDLDKYSIRPDAAIELDKLVRIMKENPTLKIELSSHTDSRASDEYNMTLSKKRAASAVKYIINKGISPDRIVSKGYGETRLINDCSDGVKCSEEKHQQNRRTEILITEI
ncbi:MAG: OmpA family protein [Bacteroidales bacterium]